LTKKADVPLSREIISKVHQLFIESTAVRVIEILENECGNKLPLLESKREKLIERVRCAVLKLGQGSPEKFSFAIESAKQDWRDVLASAGFGDDVDAHRVWLSEK
jgi:hypothetical protein